MNDHRITKGLPGVIFSLTQLPSLPTPKVKAKNNKIPPPPNIGVGSFFPSPEDIPNSGIEPGFSARVWKILWRRDRVPTPVFFGFLGGSDSKESARNVEDLG